MWSPTGHAVVVAPLGEISLFLVRLDRDVMSEAPPDDAAALKQKSDLRFENQSSVSMHSRSFMCPATGLVGYLESNFQPDNSREGVSL